VLGTGTIGLLATLILRLRGIEVTAFGRTPVLRSGGARPAMAQAQHPGWVARLLTHPVQGLDNDRELIDTLTNGKNVIKRSSNASPTAKAHTGSVPSSANECT
jgi:hypothetical protein